jgi:hypothetical protein
MMFWVSYQNVSALSFSVPGGSQAGSSYDSIDSADGVRCRTAVDAGGTFEMGVVALSEVNPNGTSSVGSDSYSRGSGAFARVTVPLSRPKKRIDCVDLYELEIERLKTQLQMMKLEMGTAE